MTACAKIIDVTDFTDMEQERIDHNVRSYINHRSETRRQMAEQEAKEAERKARLEAKMKRECIHNTQRGLMTALVTAGVIWAGYAGLIAPVIAIPVVCIGFAVFGARVANVVRLCRRDKV